MHLFKRTPTDKKPPARRVAHDQSAADRNRAFSYHANRSVSETNVGREPSAADARATAMYGSPASRFVHRLLWGMLSIGIVVLLFNQTSLSAAPKVVPLSDASSQVFLQPLSTYQQAATALFQKSFTNRNKLTINTEAMSSSLKRAFPELGSVSITLPIIGHQPTVYIQPLDPSMVLVTQGSGSFVLDMNGKALINAAGRSSQLARLGVPTVVDRSGLNISTGQTALPSTTVTFISTVAAQLRAQHIGVSSMALPPAASQLNVYIAGQPFYVKFNTEDNSALQQIGTFIATYKNLRARSTTPSQYVDVRLDGRVYYK